MKIGITASTFDLFHAGHVKMLEEAKEHCDYLIAALQVDPSIDRQWKNKPSQTIVERYIQLKACQYVDEVVPYVTEQDLEDILQAYHIDIRIIGEEYFGRDFTGKQICEDKGIQIHYNKRQHRFSSTLLRQTVYQAEAERNNRLKDTILPGFNPDIEKKKGLNNELNK